MYKNILKITQNGYYQELNDRIQNAIEKYTHAREKITDHNELTTIRSDCEEALAEILVESGFSDRQSAFISIEQEFFPQGYLDQKRVKKFQMNALLHAGEQQVHWTFAGTTMNYLPISKKAISDNGQEYANLLPQEVKTAYLEHKKKQTIHQKDADFRIYLYTDGSISSRYNQSKANINLSRLKDSSGFNWQSGYSPNNEVIRNNWTAGFNSNGEWQMLETGLEQSSIPTSGTLTDFNGSTHAPQSIAFLSIPQRNSFILFDPSALLQDGLEENYYSLSGEIYGTRSIDVENSIRTSREYLKRNKVDSLTAIVVPNKNKETIAYYKDIFADQVSENTEFYTIKSKRLREKITTLKHETANEAVSENIITDFISLTQQGRKGEDLYNGLIPSNIKADYRVPLNIFETKEDMNHFVHLPEIKESLDEETKIYLTHLTVPEDKKQAFSNLTQNVLHNYTNLFRHSNFTQRELLEQAYSAVVHNNKSGLQNQTIVREKKLPDFIKQNKLLATQPAEKREELQLDIPSFKQKFREEKDYIDITTDKGFKSWETKELTPLGLTEESIKAIQQLITDIPITNEKKEIVTKVMQDMFAEFTSIQRSTGIRPQELAAIVIKDVMYNQVENRYLNKKIYFEKELPILIEEAAQKNVNKCTIIKHDIFVRQSFPGIKEDLNLLTEKDLNTFQLSPLMSMHGLTTDEQAEIISELKTITIDSDKTHEFSKDVMHIIHAYDELLRPAHITPAETIIAVKNIIEGNHQNIKSEIRQALSKVLQKNDKKHHINISDNDHNTQHIKLNLFAEKDTEHFMQLPLFTKSGITGEQLATIIKLQKESYLEEQMEQPLDAGERTITSNSASTRLEGTLPTKSILPQEHLPKQFDQKYMHTIPIKFVSHHQNNTEKIGIETMRTKNQKNASQNIVLDAFFPEDKNILYSSPEELTVFNTVFMERQDTKKAIAHRNDTHALSKETVLKSPAELIWTDYGKKIINNQKRNNIHAMAVQAAKKIHNQNMHDPTTRTIPQLNEMVYTAPFISSKQRGLGFNTSQSATIQEHGNSHGMTNPPYHVPPATTTAHAAMDRINAHYMADKQALARNDDSSPDKKSGSAKPGGAGNKIKKGVDELFDEFINKMEYDM